MSMRTHAEEYLALRRSLGRTMRGDGRMLLAFADRLDNAEQPRITVTAAWNGRPSPRPPRQGTGATG